MELNKKSKFAENVKNKILNLQDAIERNNNIDKNTYFTQEESQFIIKYLMNCLVYNEPFDCSSLGPNKYLNE